MISLEFDWTVPAGCVCQDAPRVLRGLRVVAALRGTDPAASSSGDPHEVNPWASMVAPGSRIDCAVYVFV